MCKRKVQAPVFPGIHPPAAMPEPRLITALSEITLLREIHEPVRELPFTHHIIAGAPKWTDTLDSGILIRLIGLLSSDAQYLQLELYFRLKKLRIQKSIANSCSLSLNSTKATQ